MFVLYSLITSTIDQQESFGAATIYPVPSRTGNINIDFRNNVTGTVIVKITDSVGKEVYQTVFSNPGKEKLNLGCLSTGLYSISFINNNRIESHRMIIQ